MPKKKLKPEVELAQSTIVYRGKGAPGLRPTLVTCTDMGGEHQLPIEPSQRIRKHSIEFSWGYGGSGPAQLALAILLDVTGKLVEAEENYQDFKFEFVAKWDQHGDWAIGDYTIWRWLEERETKGGGDHG